MAGISRRGFIGALAAAGATGAARGAAKAPATAAAAKKGAAGIAAGKPLPPWKPGEFQVHFIYTGVCESMFWIMPDGTTMLLDCGDHPSWKRGKKAVWILPDGKRQPGEWIARYVGRVNPNGNNVDYLMISHHHTDHAGMVGWGAATREWKGRSIAVNGLFEAADTLKFGTCFDRGWPDFDDPIPNGRCDELCYPYLRDVFDCLCERDGMKMARFDVGATGQIALLRDPAAHPAFSITNITGNGKIRRRDGTVRDLYEKAYAARRLNENGMSLGVVAQYGRFRLFSAGDFSDKPKFADGTRIDIETELAKEMDPVNVAKVNHHGHRSMSLPLVAALRPRVWTACMWDQAHITADTLSRITSREAYPGPRLVAAGVYSPQRRLQDAGKPFVEDIAPEAFDAGHVVLTVAPGGESYTIAYVTADDESMRTTGVYEFAT